MSRAQPSGLLLDLFTDQLRSTGLVLPFTQEQLPKERVKGLLLVAILLAAAGILLLQGGYEPLEHEEGALLGVRLFGGRSKECGMLTPVRAELGQTGAGENKGRSGQTGEVSVERGDGLCVVGLFVQRSVRVLFALATRCHKVTICTKAGVLYLQESGPATTGGLGVLGGCRIRHGCKPLEVMIDVSICENAVFFSSSVLLLLFIFNFVYTSQLWSITFWEYCSWSELGQWFSSRFDRRD